MKILLIEDEIYKAERIIKLLTGKYAAASISLKSSVQEGIEALRADSPDVLILDMSLPIFPYSVQEGGFHHNAYGGEDILEYLDAHELPVPVIVITAFDKFGNSINALTLNDLDLKYKKNYSERYIGAILYSPVENSWEAELKNAIEKVQKNENFNTRGRSE